MSPTYNANLLPATTGTDLGSATQKWDLFAQDVAFDQFNSNTIPHASSGEINLGATDEIVWRDTANSSDLAVGLSGAATGTLPADCFRFGNYLLANGYISAATNPAASGVLRLANTDALKFRNAANSADINGVSADSTDTVVLGNTGSGTMGVKTGRITSFATDAANVSTVAFLRVGNNEVLAGRNSTDTADCYFYLANTSNRAEAAAPNGMLLSGTTPSLLLGGQNSAFPMLKRNGTGIDVRLADDSDYAPLTCKSLSIAGTSVGTTGVPVVLAKSYLVAQGAALSIPFIFTIPADGLFKVSYYHWISRAATTSSATQFTFNWNDGTSAKSSTGTNLTTNTTATFTQGSFTYYNTVAGGAPSFSTTYSSTGATTMQYGLALVIEYFG